MIKFITQLFCKHNKISSCICGDAYYHLCIWKDKRGNCKGCEYSRIKCSKCDKEFNND